MSAGWLTEGNVQCVEEHYRGIGGKGLNQALALKKAGEKIQFMGSVGKDGEWIVERLNKLDFPTKHISVCNSRFTGHCIIMQYERMGGKNTSVIHGGANKAHSLNSINRFLEPSLPNHDYFLMQGECNASLEMLDLANKKSLRIVYNPSPFVDVVERKEWVAKNIYLLVVNKDEFESIFGYSALIMLDKTFGDKDAVSRENEMPTLHPRECAKYTLVTLGALGSLLITPSNQIKTQPAILQPSIPLLDTTGAGDVFLGYFLANWEREGDEGALRLASVAAGICCGRIGAFDAIPEYDQVKVAMSAL